MKTLLDPVHLRSTAPARPWPVSRRGDAAEFRTEAVRYFLRTLDVFHDLPEQDVRDLAASALLRALEKGEYLFHKHESAPGLYIVRRGIINLHRVAMDGREVVIHFYREGELLAEIPADNGDGCPADACAVAPSEVVIIPWRSFLEKTRQRPDLALSMLGQLEQQLHQLADSLEGFLSTNSATRFVLWLLRRCGDGTTSVDIDLGTTKRCLASELGVRQETLSRTLRQLSDAGHLAVHGRRITIKNPSALRSEWLAHADCAAAA